MKKLILTYCLPPTVFCLPRKMIYLFYCGILVIAYCLLPIADCLAQTDTVFWFVAPDITCQHDGACPPGCLPGNYCAGGEPIYFRITTKNLASNVTISQPANPAFIPINVFIPANTTQTVDLTPRIDMIENAPPDVVLNFGFLIQATEFITIYYESLSPNNNNNPDIYALKGENALGTTFYTPFQNLWCNKDYGDWLVRRSPKCEINIVATEDNTQVDITPTADLINSTYNGISHLAGITFTIFLDRGETYCARAYGRLPAGHLEGSIVTSDKPIAVTISDDSVRPAGCYTGCYDLIGDQMVPISIIGTEYVAMRGLVDLTSPYIGNPYNGERVFVLATQDNTDIFINGAGPVATINESETYIYLFPPEAPIVTKTVHIRSSNPTYALHESGIGCELGGAILPSIDQCTGSMQVGFTRSNNREFWLNIMVRAGAENDFTLTPGPIPIPGAAFNPIPGTADWLSAQFILTGVAPVGVAMLLTNSSDLFHLGVFNGNNTGGCMYGYFSNYNVLIIDAEIVQSGTEAIKLCYGDTVQLVATGGLTDTSYAWSPATGLSSTDTCCPSASPLTDITYTVTVTGPCDLYGTADIIIDVASQLKADFTFESSSACSPFDLVFNNYSVGVDKSYYWDFGDGQTLDTTDCAGTFTHFYENTTDSSVTYEILLIVTNTRDCTDTLRRYFTLHPDVTSQFVADTTVGCNPLTVTFTNQSSGALTYHWDYGDGGTSGATDTSHIFTNLSDTVSVYTVWLIATSEDLCRDTSELEITVYPYIKADFTFEYSESCSPYALEITNSSIGVEQYLWDFGDSTTSDTSDAVFTHLYENITDTAITFQITLIVENAQGCTDTLKRNVTVFPPVISQFTPSDTIGCNPLTVVFTNQSSGADSYFWDFGDGGTSSAADTTHTFINMSANDTVYTVMLIASTEDLCYDTSFVDITVHPYLKADFTFEYADGCTPFVFDIYNNSIGASQCTWNFGDGFEITTCASIVTHPPPGYANPLIGPRYLVLRLVVENPYGCYDTLKRDVTIYPEIHSIFQADTTVGCNPLTVNFTNLSINNDTTDASYVWDFGDGGSSNSKDTSHTFVNLTDSVVVYTVWLIATSQYSCTDSSSIDITVFPYIKADFTFEYDEGCTPFEVTINNSSIGVSNYSWDFGDGTSLDTSDCALVFTHLFTNSSDTLRIFEITLIVYNAQGCPDTLKRNVTVYPPVISLFQPDTAGCHPLSVEFTNLSIGAETYNWDFGDGGTSISDSTYVSHLFDYLGNNDTTYTVQLIVTSEYLCRDTSFVDVTVYFKPEALFSLGNSSGCTPYELTINNSSTGVSIYHWDFGDGQILDSTDCAAVFTHIYENPLPSDTVCTFQLTLLVENGAGYACTDTFQQQVTVYPEVQSKFQPDTADCNPLFIQFINQSLGVGLTYSWDFADGSSSSLTDPSHTFYNTGKNDSVYTVWLIATSIHSCIDTSTNDIIVYPYLKADFSYENSAGCSPLEVLIDNYSTGGNEYYWSFGDGSDTLFTTSDASLTHTYINISDTTVNFELTLIALNDSGCPDTIIRTVTVYPIHAEFQPDTAGCHPLPVTFTNLSAGAIFYDWDFGDGVKSGDFEPSHTFINMVSSDTVYTVTLIATSQYLCADTDTAYITVYPYIEASFTLDNNAACSPFEVTINNSSSGVYNYEWYFGDSDTSNTSAPVFTHTYINLSDTIQNFILTLIVENSDVCFDTMQRIITVYPEIVASFIPAPTAGCHPLFIDFTNQTTGASDYLWSFGDGGISNAVDTSHFFVNYSENNITYSVTLQAVSQFGCTDDTVQIITVYPSAVADFIPSPLYQVYPSATVYFDSVSSGYATYFWYFGDGDTSDSENPPPHTYDTWGEYVITLIVCTGYNCCDSVSNTIIIESLPPVADFTPLDTSGCPPLTVEFNNTSMYADTYTWDFGDGTFSSEKNPTHTFYESRQYNIKLTASGDGGQDVNIGTVTVYDMPNAYFKIKPFGSPTVVQVPNQPIYCYDLSNIPVPDSEEPAYFWDFGDGTTSTEQNPTHIYTKEGTYSITLQVCTEYNCCNAYTLENAVVAKVYCKIEFPNAFTPNPNAPPAYGDNCFPDDYSNDVFCPVSEGIIEYELNIFNRWGELLFESKDIDIGWDGYYRGELCKQDVYVWKATGKCINGEEFKKVGDVTLLR